MALSTRTSSWRSSRRAHPRARGRRRRAQYILELCDTNENGMIDRDELQPMIARWKMIARRRLRSRREWRRVEQIGHQKGQCTALGGPQIGGSLHRDGQRTLARREGESEGHGGASDATDSASSGPLSRDGSTRSLTRRLTTTFTKTAPGAMFRMASSMASMLTLSHLRRSSAKVAAGTRVR